jgi:hypothetical protein
MRIYCTINAPSDSLVPSRHRFDVAPDAVKNLEDDRYRARPFFSLAHPEVDLRGAISNTADCLIIEEFFDYTNLPD